MMITTKILHNVEPTCKPRYAVGSSLHPLLAPFQIAISFECLQLLGILFVIQMVLYSFSISFANSLHLIACFMYAAGISLADLQFFKLLTVDFISSVFGAEVFRPFKSMFCSCLINSGTSLSSIGSCNSVDSLKCALKYSESLLRSHVKFSGLFLNVVMSDLMHRYNSSTFRRLACSFISSASSLSFLFRRCLILFLITLLFFCTQ